MSQSEKAGMHILFRRLTFFFLAAGALIASLCHAEIKPDRDNIVRDVSGMTELYNTMIPVGAAAPNFELKDLNGKFWDTKAIFGKNVTVIYFWSAFCPYCKESMPRINKLYEQYKQRGLKALAVNLDGIDFSNAIKSFINDGKITMPVPVDKLYQNKFFTAGDPYGVSKTPTVFLIDKSGRVAFAAEVELEYELIGKLIEKHTKNVKRKVVIIIVSVVVILSFSVMFYLFYLRPHIIQEKIIDDLKRRTQDELKKQDGSI